MHPRHPNRKALYLLGAVVLALAVALLLAPARAQPAPAYVDTAALDTLFSQLRTAPDPATAQALADQIWQVWTTPDDPDITTHLAELTAAMSRGDYPTALDIARALTVRAPDYAEGWNQLATIEYMLGQYQASLADIDETLKREPRHFGALAGEALVQLKLGDRAAALAAIKQALDIHPFLAERGLFPELGPPPTRT
jgi:tetratricopeptide (TPR) repeat protein